MYFPLKGDLRREIQILFQHPETSFDPRMTLEKSLLEPFCTTVCPWMKRALLQSLSSYGLTLAHLQRLPRQLSGGELQRLAILRVLALKPSFLVLDEPTSMLDAISQAQILDILKGLNQQLGLSYLFITHDPDVATRFCSRIFQLEDGVCKALTI